MKNKRIVQAVVGCVVLLIVGMVYAWSVLSTPIAAEFPQWNKAQLSLTFTIVMILFCVGGLVGGLLAAKIKPGVYLWASAVLFLLGFFLASRTQSLIALYIGFGVICGFGSGIAYNAVMATVSKWFPDCPGLISGILLMGFGLSSFLIGKIYQACTPDTIGAWRSSFVWMGLISFAVLFLCGFLLKKAGGDFAPPAAKAKKNYVNPAAVEAGTGDMLKTPRFWLYYVWAILLSAAGLAIVSQASGIAREIGTEIPAGTIVTVVGMISIFNGIGRVIFGALFDRLGRRVIMQMVNICYIVTGIVLAIALGKGSFALLVVGFVLGGLSYGGVTPTNSAFISSYFGMKHYPLNFSVVNTNLIIASFGSTVAGSLYDATRSYMSTYVMVCALAVSGILISWGISLCDKKQLKKQK